MSDPASVPRTALVVDDETPVRVFVAIFLRRLGYTVLEAGSAAEARSAAASHPDPIHLLVTDVSLPECPARDLVESLTASRPGLKALYVSGFDQEGLVADGLVPAGAPFLQKPFTPGQLAGKVREALGG